MMIIIIIILLLFRLNPSIPHLQFGFGVNISNCPICVHTFYNQSLKSKKFRKN